jgi:hypothetical protein
MCGWNAGAASVLMKIAALGWQAAEIPLKHVIAGFEGRLSGHRNLHCVYPFAVGCHLCGEPLLDPNSV